MSVMNISTLLLTECDRRHIFTDQSVEHKGRLFMSYTFTPGRTAIVTGAARGQGRAHAVKLASCGVDVAVLDICAPVETVPYKASTPEDLEETVRLIEKEGAKALPFVVDVRDLPGMQSAAESVVDQWGRIDFLVANAGILSYGKTHELTSEQWHATIDVHLTGVWHALKAVLPTMIDAGFGRVVGTTSGTIRNTGQNIPHYAAAKAGILSLMKSVAIEYGHQGITANSISPSNVNTDMIMNDAVFKLFCPELENPTLEDVRPRMASIHVTGIDFLEPSDVSEGVAFLLSEEGRFITGIELPMTYGRTGGL
jgi:SDR family mycofactocin-dependent oxidoreductase